MTELWICRYTGLSSEQARRRVKGLLKAVLSKRIPESTPEQLIFEYGKYGKPSLKNAELQFSVSYTHEACIIALSGNEIGADIERLRANRLRVVNRCFTNSEKQHFYQDTGLLDRRFYEIWTQKEAYLKYTGQGFYQPPQSVDVLSPSIRRYLYTLTDDDMIISLCGRDIHPISIYRVALT